jgi:hypothetical protein
MAEKYPEAVAVSESTDWDFYGCDSEENRRFLVERGFQKVEAENREYWDDLLLDIYKHQAHPIEVLIRSDVSLYSCAFESVSAEEFVNKLWKSSPKTDPGISRSEFRGRVCDYFNRLFDKHRPKIDLGDGLPF